MTDPYKIERFKVPGLPPKFRVIADRQHGPEFATRAEAEKRRDQLLRKA
ncbi:hypothetical protein [Streptomyces sp. NPDC014793]